MTGTTKSERYFLDLFGAASLTGAIEKAAETARCEALISRDRVPVNIREIAMRRRIRVTNDLQGDSCREGVLIPATDGDGYIVQLRRGATETRRRFSLAHELGHTLFYQNTWRGPQHQIGILSIQEKRAEERICNLFASALLMPRKKLLEHLGPLTIHGPAQLLNTVESASKHFGVSPPALLRRIRSLELPGSPYIVVCMSNRPNSSTGEEPKLRVGLCVGVGSGSAVKIWPNQSAQSIGLTRAAVLYDEWVALSENARTGCFALDQTGHGLVDATLTQVDSEKSVHFSRYASGKWSPCVMDASCSSRLYSWVDGPNVNAYTLTAIALDFFKSA